MDFTIAPRLSVPAPPKDPSEAEVRAAGEALSQLESEARSLGASAGAAPLHYRMGRIYGEQLGDLRSAAVCFQ